jgi:hypothetical protein
MSKVTFPGTPGVRLGSSIIGKFREECKASLIADLNVIPDGLIYILSVTRSCLLHRTSSVVMSAPPHGFGIFGFSAAGLPWTAHHEIGTRIISCPFQAPGAIAFCIPVKSYPKVTSSASKTEI